MARPMKWWKRDPVTLQRTGGRYLVAHVELDGATYEVTHRGAVAQLGEGKPEPVTDPELIQAVQALLRDHLRRTGRLKD